MVAKPLRRFFEYYRLSHDRREVVVAAIVWGVVVASVPLSRLFDYWRSDSSVSIEWDGMADEFLALIPFAALFVFNDLVLANVIVRLRKVVLYVVLAIMSALFMSLVLEFFRAPRDVGEGAGGEPVHVQEPREPQPYGMGGRPEPDTLILHDSRPPMDERRGMPFSQPQGGAPVPPPKPMGDDNGRGRSPDPWRDGGFRPDSDAGRQKRPVRGLGPMVSDFVLALMMMCAGTLVKVYLIADRDKARLRQLAKERAEAELAQLRYQISPHFLMNTLNNIHALVDIDAERAKDTIVRLSRLMRYMLHDGSSQLVPLASEVSFLSDYVALMRIRYTDAVSIRLSMPADTDGVSVPPLLFINVVENAFKHGVSYASDSFVDIRLSLSPSRDCLDFCCVNSLAPVRQADGPHGIGLANTRKRLDLLCHGRYQLSEVKLDDRYVVSLTIRLA